MRPLLGAVVAMIRSAKKDAEVRKLLSFTDTQTHSLTGSLTD